MQPGLPHITAQPVQNAGTHGLPLRLWYGVGAVAVVILIAVALLLVTSYARINDLRAQDAQLTQMAVDGTAAEIEQAIDTTRRMLQLFAERESALLGAIAGSPDDETLRLELDRRTRTIFPDAFAVSLADEHGTPLIAEFSGLVEEVCRAGIREFALNQSPPPLFIHPNPEGYHVDLMVRTRTTPNPLILFVSFRPDVLTRPLSRHQLPHRELLLINSQRKALVEITSDGSRDTMQREAFLSATELASIEHQTRIAGTQWQLVGLPTPQRMDGVHSGVWRTTATVVGILLAVGLIAIVQLLRAEQRTRANNKLLHAVSRAESRFIAEGDIRTIFDSVLDDLLELTGSEYGFIGEILHTEDNAPYLRSYAITNIAWNEETRRLYEESAPSGLEFRNLDTLFGAVLRHAEPVISNNPAEDPRAGGLPPGHPPLRSFLGIPLCHGPHFVGMIGLANRPGGFDMGIKECIEPILRSSANLFWALKSDRQRAAVEEALHESNTRHQTILNTVFDGIITLSQDGIVESFNPAAERIFGYAANEVTGHSLRELLDDAYLRTHGESIIAGLRNGSTATLPGLRDAVGKRNDGSSFPAEISISETPLGNLRLYTLIVRDITKRKRTEQELMQTTRLQRAVLDSTHYSIISTDANGIIQTFNAGAERMLGYTQQEMVGRQTPEIIHDREEVVCRARELSQELGYTVHPGFDAFVARARRGDMEEREWTYIRKDGSRLPVLLSVTALYGESGTPAGFLGIASDITERQKIDRMKREFIATVSHELRTPLTAIRGSLGLIAGGAVGEVPPKALELIDIASHSSDRLVRLINDILDIEKIESGRIAFRFRQQPLLPIVERAMTANRGYADQYGVQLRLVQSASPVVDVDSDRLTQVIDNLLSNAIKFSARGSEVVVTISQSMESVRVSVTDAGPGIPVEFRPRLFSKFAQADASDSRQRNGTGLGLAISRSIIDMHHGTISYRSEPGRGSEFYFDLPRVAAEAKAASTQP